MCSNQISMIFYKDYVMEKKMKLMTLNAHSHAVGFPEELFRSNLDALADCIIRQQADVIALQEVCQTRDRQAVSKEMPGSYVPVNEETVIREDNYALQLMYRLKEQGYAYSWTWDGIKVGYGVFDEGLAVISRLPIERAEAYYLSDSRDYHNWKTRKAVSIQTGPDGQKSWFVSAHLGWWEDAEEPFSRQMDRLQKQLSGKEGNIYLMGDFNSPANQRNTGYDYVRGCGWLDTCRLSGKKENEITVPGKIDGWGREAEKGLCIDYIWSKYPVEVTSFRAAFSGEREPVISDHYGILAEIAAP